jgi:hypothetical protein
VTKVNSKETQRFILTSLIADKFRRLEGIRNLSAARF